MKAILLLWALLAAAPREYTGPMPPQADVPCLLHADNLVETESGEASEQKRGRDTVYSVAGATSPARTPLAEPIFLLRSEKIAPDSLELYAMEVRAGNREVVFPERKDRAPRPKRLMWTKLADKLFRIEVSENLGLDNGEYSLTPRGTNQVFCFTVY
ncbi:MAG: hypothetical protein FJW34_00330 [Acidobacteria bacterium]|nr:hypothetical protein [Acidobacteriota bacterium]